MFIQSKTNRFLYDSNTLRNLKVGILLRNRSENQVDSLRNMSLRRIRLIPHVGPAFRPDVRAEARTHMNAGHPRLMQSWTIPESVSDSVFEDVALDGQCREWSYGMSV
jgi:hypothetical protein